MTELEPYLREVHNIRALGAGVNEKSYYPALRNLLNEVGEHLKPKVHCVMELKNLGAGNPDGGLFTAEQFPKGSQEKPELGQMPSRGAIEVKPAKDDAWVKAGSGQVTGYWKKYRQVLVTNYRDFVLVGQDREGNAVKLEAFSLAPDEKSFWGAAPRTLDQELGVEFTEFLRRVMLHAAQLAAPEDVAWFLASYARQALRRIEKVELPALSVVRKALEEALGLKFEGAKGEHFFLSSLVQTLFYGVFSAWVLWAKETPPSSRKRFDWRLTSSFLRVPMISKLFYLIADPNQLENMNLTEVLDWTGQVLNRVVRGSFSGRFQESEAVRYFYEPFLAKFDPTLRKKLGVWYTPTEVVKYMVERVDRVLRSELEVPLGLADKNVYVLDPCCGTGSYLVEVLNRIYRTLKEHREDALLASDLKDIALKRVFGFEILPASFVVSHLQLGLLLQNLGAPLSERPRERVGVYLTNSLTGWEPPHGPKRQLTFWEFQEERDRAERVKREVPILVIIGNPPYDGFAGVSPAEERGLVEPYKKGLISEWGIKKFNLDDLYVRFFRLAERRIVQGPPGKGILCFISNFSYLSDPSFVVMRKRFLDEFDKSWIDCMNGDSRETGKLTPDGKPDPSVFSTKRNREGIRVGTAVGLFVRAGTIHQKPMRVHFRNFWGVTKNRDLLESLNGTNLETEYRPAQPAKSNRYALRPSMVTFEYGTWPQPLDLCKQTPISGLQEMRRGALMDLHKVALQKRLAQYLDADNEFSTLEPSGLKVDGGRFNARTAREKILQQRREILEVEQRDPDRVVRYALYPLDSRWAYYSSVRPLWNEPRPALVQQSWPGNTFFVVRMFAERPHENVPMVLTKILPDYHLLRPNVVAIPTRTREFPKVQRQGRQHTLPGIPFEAGGAPKANLSLSARAYLTKLGIGDVDADSEAAELIWMHALAIGYSPSYLSENADGIRLDWPRIPMPGSKDLLLVSAKLGRQIADLLDTETQFDVRAHPCLSLKNIGEFTFAPAQERPLREEDKGEELKSDLSITAGWGHLGKGGVTMPGKGRIVERDYTAHDGGTAPAPTQLGVHTCDVYLNDATYWKNIPLRVWEYTIGGYPVIKKWLSYRERKLLGRALTKHEVRYVQEMAQRVAAIILLEPALDSSYRDVKEHTYPWTDAAS